MDDVDIATARDRVSAGAMLLDVRTPEEWTAGHAGEAVWIPMAEIEARHAELPADSEIMVICRSGQRSGVVATALRGAGYDATNVAGGMVDWDASGLPVVTDAGTPGTVS
jgi:rhodanese-related sulfurtransferase